MKTTNFRLFVTMITLAAVITIGTAPATAQRRSTGVNNTETREQKSNTEKKSSEQTQNNSNNNRSATTVNKSASTQNRQTTPAQRNTNVRTETSNRAVSPQGNNTQRRETTAPQVTRNQSNTNNNSTVNTNSERNRNVEQNRNQTQNNSSTVNRANDNSTRRNSSTSVSSGSEYNRNVNNPEARRSTENARRIYRIDENDRRYTPNNDFKGNNQSWSQNHRPANMYYNHNDRNFYRNYNYWSYKHWDRSWESYRWNFYSWRDYYNGYNPYSYRFHRNYAYHPRYGHVIKRFVVRPIILSHNNIRYYCYDGHFFRHLRGVGYVLVDIPFGIVFNTLPYEYERVYINGYLYFRIGNLFFERTNFGFSLVHYPERYYALNDGFSNGGYYFDDDIYW
jgi:hypothetical protein